MFPIIGPLGGIEKDRKRMATLMTETDALALCLAPELNGDYKTFAKDNYERAAKRLAKLFKDDRIDDDTFARCGSRMGNISATRQWAVKQGLLPASDEPEDALAKAVKAELGKGVAQITKNLK